MQSNINDFCVLVVKKWMFKTEILTGVRQIRFEMLTFPPPFKMDPVSLGRAQISEKSGSSGFKRIIYLSDECIRTLRLCEFKIWTRDMKSEDFFWDILSALLATAIDENVACLWVESVNSVTCFNDYSGYRHQGAWEKVSSIRVKTARNVLFLKFYANGYLAHVLVRAMNMKVYIVAYPLRTTKYWCKCLPKWEK